MESIKYKPFEIYQVSPDFKIKLVSTKDLYESCSIELHQKFRSLAKPFRPEDDYYGQGI